MKIKVLPFLITSILISAAILPLSWKAFTGMKLDTSIHEVLKTDSQSQEAYDKFHEAFNDSTIVIAVAKIDNLFSNEGAKKLFELSEALQAIPDLQDIKSLTHSTRPVKGDFSMTNILKGNFKDMLKMKYFMDINEKSDEEWKALKEFNLNYPMTRGVLVSPCGNYANVIAVLNRDVETLERKKEVMQQAREKAAPFIAAGMTVKFLSEPFISAEFDDLVKEFLLYFIILSLTLMAIVIYISFKSWAILSLMILYQLCGFLIFPIVFFHNLTGTNLFTFIIIPLVSTIQLTFLTHFYSVFQHEAAKSDDTGHVFRQTLKTVFSPSLTALFTSLIGLGALCISEVEILKTVGLVGMESLLLIFILTFLPPALFCLKKDLSSDKAPYSAEPHRLTPFLSKNRFILPIGALLITLAAGISFNYISSDIRAEEFLDPASETRQAIDLLDEHFGGVSIMQLEVETEKDNGIQDYAAIQYLHNLRNESLKLKGIQSAYTYSQFYTVVYEAVNGTELSVGNILPDKITCELYSKIINSFNFPFKHIFEGDNRTKTVFFLRTEHLPTEEYLQTVRQFEQLADRNRPPGVQVKVSEGIHSILESDRKIVNSQVFSAGSSLFCIFVCLLMVWRSFRLASAALICNILPLASILLIMALSGIPLNSITVMVSAIILGISTDDSIHFLNFFKNRLAETGDPGASVSAALRYKIRPMACTSFILIICLLLFLLAPFPPINQFGILGGAALLCGFLSSCLLLPALLLLMYKKSGNIKKNMSDAEIDA